MSEPTPSIDVRSPAAPAAPWPRAVAWLAVVAHFGVADVIGVTSQRSKNDLEIVRDAAILLAQADLLVIWLVLGSSRWIRRLPWSLCGMSGVGLVFYMHNFNEVRGVVLYAYLIHLSSTALAIGFLRFLNLRIVRLLNPTAAAAHDRRNRKQFSILDLFGAALAVAIAVSWVVRMERVPDSSSNSGALLFLGVVGAPLSLFALISAAGMRNERRLMLQLLLIATATIFVSTSLRDDDSQKLRMLYVCHWFLVAGTLWIFQMCGYRLVRVEPLENEPGGQNITG